ncbi:MAG: hypothetical protein AAGK37_08215 [Pseudomonadota bacterium]
MRCSGLAAAGLLVGCTGAMAQSVDGFDAAEIADTTTELTERKLGFMAGSFFAAPIPLSNPTIGSGLLAVGGYLFQMDEGSDTSFLGVAAFRTDNGSEGLGLAGSISFDEDRWQATLAAADASVTYDVFFGPLAVPVEQTGQAYFSKLGYAVSGRVAVGGELSYLDSKISLPFIPENSPILRDLDLSVVQTGLFATFDSTDDDLFPRKGTWVDGTLSFGQISGDDRDFTTAVALWNQYFPIGPRDTIATRATICASDETTPFFLQCSIGQTDDFRGFTSFQFRGEALASLQAEYRGRIGSRFGYAVFGGIGAVGDDFGDLGSASSQYAGGVGLRYQVTRDFPLDLSLDYAGNSEGEKNVYLYIGQAF